MADMKNIRKAFALIAFLLIFSACSSEKLRVVDISEPPAGPEHPLGREVAMNLSAANFTLPQDYHVFDFQKDESGWGDIFFTGNFLHHNRRGLFGGFFNSAGDSVFLFESFPERANYLARGLTIDQSRWYAGWIESRDNIGMNIIRSAISAYSKSTGEMEWQSFYNYGELRDIVVQDGFLYVLWVESHTSSVAKIDARSGEIIAGPVAFHGLGYDLVVDGDDLFVGGDISFLAVSPELNYGGGTDLFLLVFNTADLARKQAVQYGGESYEMDGYLCVTGDFVYLSGKEVLFEPSLQFNALIVRIDKNDGLISAVYRDSTGVQDVLDIAATDNGEIFTANYYSRVNRLHPGWYEPVTPVKGQRIQIVNNTLYYSNGREKIRLQQLTEIGP